MHFLDKNRPKLEKSHQWMSIKYCSMQIEIPSTVTGNRKLFLVNVTVTFKFTANNVLH